MDHGVVAVIGPEGAASLLAARLATALPAKTAELRDRLVLDPMQLPDFTEVWAHQAGSLGIESWPLIEITNTADAAWVPLADSDPGTGRAWRIGYGLAVWLWARGDGYDDTAAVRGRLTLAVCEVLAARLVLSDDPVARISDQGLSVSYSDVGTDTSKRTIAGAKITLTVNVDESLTGTSVPLVDVIHIDTRRIPAEGPLVPNHA